MLTQVLAALHRDVVVSRHLAQLARETLRAGEPTFKVQLEALRNRTVEVMQVGIDGQALGIGSVQWPPTIARARQRYGFH